MSHKPFGNKFRLLSPSHVIMTFRDVCERLDTPVSLGVYLRLKYSEFDSYVKMSIDPADYIDSGSFFRDYQAVKGLSKAAFLETSIDRKAAAMDKFWEAEKSCSRTNSKFDFIMYEGGAQKLADLDPEMWNVLSRARHEILKIIGSEPNPRHLKPKFGPGVTSLVKGMVTLPKKYAPKAHITPGLFPYLLDIVGPHWMRSLESVEIVKGNSVSFVDKNAKTDRAIAVEPHLNVYVQLAYGSYLSDLFSRRVKYHFKEEGQVWNRFLASVARDWNLSTVDLSSASDTISTSLVWFLLPEAWVTALDECRSHQFRIGKEWFRSEKFSSMGNGFTFELESIIFYALSIACGSQKELTSCFGDDIICESRITPLLFRVLDFCGFTVNKEKSFTAGNFFESCGHDYFDGKFVRPFFWSKIQETTPYKMLNDISRLASCGTYRDKSYLGPFKTLINVIKHVDNRLLDCRIPYGYGDVGIWSEWDESCPSRLRFGHDGWSTKALRFRPRKLLYGRNLSGYLSSLDTGSLTSDSPVRKQGVYEIGHLATFGSWVGPGPWI